jgi:hypothetical protein
MDDLVKLAKLELKKRVDEYYTARDKCLIQYFIVVGLDPKCELEPMEKTKKKTPLETAYKANIIQSYPNNEPSNTLLPKHTWMFCFPEGCKFSIKREDVKQYLFVLTLADGKRLYGSVIKFYRKISDENKKKLFPENTENENSKIFFFDFTSKTKYGNHFLTIFLFFPIKPKEKFMSLWQCV